MIANRACLWCHGTGYRRPFDLDDGSTSTDVCPCVHEPEPATVDRPFDAERTRLAVEALHGELVRLRRPGARAEAESIGRAFRLHARARREPARVVEALTRLDRVEAARLARVFFEAGRWAA